MARTEPTLYDVLDVDPGASAAEVRAAYVRLARHHHPDFHTTASDAHRLANEREMQRINEAWTVLGDADQRRAYDERIRLEVAQEGQREPRGTRRPGAADYGFRPYDEGPDVDYAALLDDTPVAGTAVSRAMQVIPPALLLGGALIFVVGAIVNLAPLLAIGIIGVVLGLIGFLATPAMAIARSLQAERDP